MNITLSLPPKSPLRSKAVWTAIASGLLGVYELAAPLWQPPLPPVPDGLYLLLAGLGVYGLRAARRPLEVGTGAPAAPVSYSIPDASLALPDAGITNPAGVPLLGLPTGVAALAGSLLGSPMLDGAVRALLQAAGLPTGAQQVLAVGVRLAPIAPDLFDGNPQLDTANLARLNRVILDLKAEHLGGTA
ncbi:hypothetical protein [uncultured Deinococcus sp.]|uniref:hypothetical protein n=1 Tax=uncultured Deinococcus sp. TaxID=158789 RepID=UPI0025F6E085|nr:hypothetical protein [uncultured Deinococcus sp.]